ncbi:vWA domain-containing protein [Pontibacter chinhatensis]|uniref:von Willebrand factor type A domain-containing protein n=1 Tax=Pontibacter chinhatensis TaxID=1436961 RepID=A0A1I2QPE2_9BACT|nr:VWA domain-containing protein [Pontibacter chinhatensis]SFG29533.1 von Willebrand factor type A domain-containing protein [Pontibacter chinhatensis]
MSTKKIHNLIILDESGSMQSIKTPTITGFNEVVQTVKGAKEKYPEQEHFISLFTFNGDGIKPKLFMVPIAALEEIDGNIYQPNSMTPLFDAIGISVNKLKYNLTEVKDYNVLVTILTDGYENASKEFTGSEVKKLVEELKSKGWTFTYIGANHDVEQVAMSISITNVLKFESNDSGTNSMWAKERSSRMNYLRKLSLNEDAQDNYFREDPQNN